MCGVLFFTVFLFLKPFRRRFIRRFSQILISICTDNKEYKGKLPLFFILNIGEYFYKPAKPSVCFTESQHGLLVTDNSLYSGHRACACAVSDPDLAIREGSPKSFCGPSGFSLVKKLLRGRAPRAPPLDRSLMWTGIRSPSQCWRGGSVLWTIFIEIKKIYNLKLNHVLKGITFQFIFYFFKNT